MMVLITTDKSHDWFPAKYPKHPEYTPRSYSSNFSSAFIAAILGVPVIEPGGKALVTAAKFEMSGFFEALMLEDMWWSVEKLSMWNNLSRFTELADFPKSLRIKSTIIKFSARSFVLFLKIFIFSSSPLSLDLLIVPLIGLALMLPSLSILINLSGEEDKIWLPRNLIYAE